MDKPISYIIFFLKESEQFQLENCERKFLNIRKKSQGLSQFLVFFLEKCAFSFDEGMRFKRFCILSKGGKSTFVFLVMI